MWEPMPQNHPNLLVGQLRITTGDTTQYGVYSTGTVKKFIPGTRYRIGDSVYKFGKAAAAIKGRHGAFNNGAYNGTVTTGSRVIGDMNVGITLDGTTGGATWFGTKNNMVGGYYSQPDLTNAQLRMIVGHQKGASAVIIKVYLDGPLTRNVITGSVSEWIQNPYNQLGSAGGEFKSVMGIPTTAIALGSYGWLQTWGPCSPAPGLPVADTASWRETWFVGDGSIRGGTDLTIETGFQHCGFVIDYTGAGGGADNPPYVMLQISP